MHPNLQVYAKQRTLTCDIKVYDQKTSKRTKQSRQTSNTKQIKCQPEPQINHTYLRKIQMTQTTTFQTTVPHFT